MVEHPDVHEYVLKDHNTRLEELETAMKDIQAWKSANDEKTKTLFVMLAELKEMLQQYTSDMREAIANLTAKMEARFLLIDKDLNETKAKPDRKASAYIEKAMTFALGGIIAYLVAQVLK